MLFLETNLKENNKSIPPAPSILYFILKNNQNLVNTPSMIMKFLLMMYIAMIATWICQFTIWIISCNQQFLFFKPNLGSKLGKELDFELTNLISNHLGAVGPPDFRKTFQKVEENAPYCVAPLSLAGTEKTLRAYSCCYNLIVSITTDYPLI